jgi:hypothetical protein
MDEIGWGQFEMIIKINLRKPFQSSNIEMNHCLKFHPSKSSKQPYTFQSYDEIVLHNCPIELINRYEYLKTADALRVMPNYEDFSFESLELVKQLSHDKKMDLRIHEEAMLNAIEYINEELKNLRERIVQTEDEIASSYNELMHPNEQRAHIYFVFKFLTIFF